MRKCDLTIGVTAHNEGILAHKTMLSIFEAAKLLDQHKITYEILVHIDKGDKLTKDNFKVYNNSHLRIIEGDFGDLGLSRNRLASMAKGKYLAFLDADDLVSSNWYYDAYQKLIKSKKPILVHPAYNLTFGRGITNQVLWYVHGTHSYTTDAFLSVGVNCWTSCVMGATSTFLDHPYPATAHGYGNEDWFFNTEALSYGILHLTVPNAVHFYRQRPNSLLSQSNTQNLAQGYSHLLDIHTFRKLKSDDIKMSKIRPDLVSDATDAIPPEPKEPTTPIEPDLPPPRRSLLYRVARHAYHIVFPPKALEPAVEEDAPEPEVPPPRPGDLVPPAVLNEWRKISKIETSLYPTEGSLFNLTEYHADTQIEQGLAYHQLIQPIDGQLPYYIFIVPWVSVGGADKLLINYLKAIEQIHPDRKVAVITTVPNDNKWQAKLPKNSYHVDFGNITKEILDFPRLDRIFTRLIVQLQAKNIHIINSEFAYQWASVHQTLIKDNYTLDVSIFGRVPIPETGNRAYHDYADPDIIAIYPLIHNIYTDNQNTVKERVIQHNFSPHKFVVEYQPAENNLLAITPIYNQYNSAPLKILWASRVESTKNPELLIAIAKKLDPAEYTIDVYGTFCNGYSAEDFDNIPALHYRGAFKSIDELPIDKYDTFLYTSRSDGLPNILLEMAARGIPIIASDAGGVGDFIKPNQTGLLIKEQNNPEPYLDALQYASSHPSEMTKLAKGARTLCEKRHSFEAYLQSMRRHFKE
ncbi:glycosyltransferase [Candidatus Saccharibacteria bacterium]|nr:glycosyltransferase [Candidatus Saccharibacteria bacterium]